MTVREIVSALSLEVAAGTEGLNREVTGGYACDLMSCVMVRARKGDAWVTVQSHQNIVAIANLLDLACVIITEGPRPDEDALSRADKKGIPILLTTKTTFAVAAQLDRLGIKGSRS